MFANNFDLFAVEFTDASGNLSFPWQTFDTFTNADRFTFGAGAGITLVPNGTTSIPFNGDASQLNQELQAFFGF